MAVMTYAEAAVLAVAHEMEADANVVVLGEDVGRGGIFGQYKGLQARFGTDRVIDTPISEAASAPLGWRWRVRPVVECGGRVRLVRDGEIANQAARPLMAAARARAGGRMPSASGIVAAQHSQSLERWFAHRRGGVVCPPRADNYSRCARPGSGDGGYMGTDDLGVSASRTTATAGARRGGGPAATSHLSWSKQVQACEQAATRWAAGSPPKWSTCAALPGTRPRARLLAAHPHCGVHEAVQAAGRRRSPHRGRNGGGKVRRPRRIRGHARAWSAVRAPLPNRAARAAAGRAP